MGAEDELAGERSKARFVNVQQLHLSFPIPLQLVFLSVSMLFLVRIQPQGKEKICGMPMSMVRFPFRVLIPGFSIVMSAIQVCVTIVLWPGVAEVSTVNPPSMMSPIFSIRRAFRVYM